MPDNSSKKAVIYTRVSTEEQKESWLQHSEPNTALAGRNEG
jgi:DNA invertase Pin-like site-specific DNA recombinase